MPKLPDFSPAIGRAVVACVLIGVAALLFMATAAIALLSYLGLAFSGGTREALGIMYSASAVAFLLASAAAAVAFAIWLHRVVRNLPALGEPARYLSPKWAVAWLFVPVTSLFLPFVIIQQAWQASDPARGANADGRDRPQRISLLLGTWWTGWLACNPISVVLLDYVLGIFLPASARSGLVPVCLTCTSTLVYTATSALAVAVVMGLQRRQERRFGMLAADAQRSVSS